MKYYLTFDFIERIFPKIEILTIFSISSIYEFPWKIDTFEDFKRLLSSSIF